MSLDFPPMVGISRRVWSYGYRDHGPLEGPKIDIAENMGGTVTSVEPRFGEHLWTVKWDNGQVSKHYATSLNCIGRFNHVSEYDAAVQAVRVLGPVEVTIGPQGGFRGAKLRLEYDGAAGDIELYKWDRKLWFDCLEGKARQAGVEITTVHLPPKRRKKGGTP